MSQNGVPWSVHGGAGIIRGERWSAGEHRGQLLLMHGGGQTRRSWERSVPSLTSAGWDVATFDARGHGDSDWAANGDYSLEALVADLILVVGQLGGPLPVLIGASMGGMAGLAAEGRHRGLARALVLVDIAPRVETAGVERISAFMRSAPDGFESLDDAADAIAAYQPHRARPRDLNSLQKNLRRAENGRYFWHWDPAFVALGTNLDRPEDHRVRLLECARAITLPTLLVHGGRSDIVSQEGIDELRDLIPGAEASTVPDAGHMVAGDGDNLFALGINEFLDRLPAVEMP